MKLKDMLLNENEIKIIEAAIFLEQLKYIKLHNNEFVLEEGIVDLYQSTLTKVYGSAQSLIKGSGLIGQLTKTIKNTGAISVALFTYLKSNHTEEDIATFKAAWENVKPKKEHIFEFLINLDMVTLHAITGPMHLLHAITGINLEAVIDHKLKSYGLNTDSSLGLVGNIYTLAAQIKEKVKALIHGEEQEKVLAAVNNLATALPGPTPHQFLQ